MGDLFAFDLTLINVIITILCNEKINPLKCSISATNIVELLKKNNVISDILKKNGRLDITHGYLIKFVNRYSNHFGLTECNTKKRIWWKGHPDPENMWIIQSEKNALMFTFWDNMIYWCVVQCQRAKILSFINTNYQFVSINDIYTFYNSYVLNSGYSLFPQLMKHGDLIRYLRKKKTIFKLQWLTIPSIYTSTGDYYISLLCSYPILDFSLVPPIPPFVDGTMFHTPYMYSVQNQNN